MGKTRPGRGEHGGHRLGCGGTGLGGGHKGYPHLGCQSPWGRTPWGGTLLAVVGCMGGPGGCWGGVAPCGVTCPTCPLLPKAGRGGTCSPSGTHALGYTCQGGLRGEGPAPWGGGGCPAKVGPPPPQCRSLWVLPVLPSLGGAPAKPAWVLSPALSPMVLQCPVGSGASAPWLYGHAVPTQAPLSLVVPRCWHGGGDLGRGWCGWTAVMLSQGGVMVCVSPQAGDMAVGVQAAPSARSASTGDKSQQRRGHGVSLGTVPIMCCVPPTPRWGCRRRQS